MSLDMPNRFSRITIILHWIVALSMIGLLAVGVYMVETKAYGLYAWHKSFGFLLFFVVVVRVAWRLKNGWPTPVREYPTIEQSLAKAVHWALLIGTVLMPLSGFLMSAFGGHGVDVFGLEVVARNADPENPVKAIAHNQTIAGLCSAIHHWLGYILIAAVILHVSAAFKHHAIDKDGTLKRMLGKTV